MAEIEGLREFLRTLERLPDGIAPKGGGPFERALRAGAGVWRDSAKQIASGIGPGKKTGRTKEYGRLKDNISVRKDDDPQANGFTHRFTVSYGKAFWGKYVELGTEAFKDKRDYPSTPFLRPAFDQNKDAILQKISQTLRRDIPKAVQDAKR